MAGSSRESSWHLTFEELVEKASLMVLSSSEKNSRRLARGIDSYLREECGFSSRLHSIEDPLIEEIIFQNEPTPLVFVVLHSQEAREFLNRSIPTLWRLSAVIISAQDLDNEILCDYDAQRVLGNLCWPTGNGGEVLLVKTIHLVLKTAYTLLETLPFNPAELFSREPIDYPAP